MFINIFTKDPDYATKIMESCVVLNELEVASTRRYFIDSSGEKETKKFTHRQPFGLHFRYRNQAEDQNNQRHAPIYL